MNTLKVQALLQSCQRTVALCSEQGDKLCLSELGAEIIAIRKAHVWITASSRSQHTQVLLFCRSALGQTCSALVSEKQPGTETTAAPQLLRARSKRKSEGSSHKGNRVALRILIVLIAHFNYP